MPITSYSGLAEGPKSKENYEALGRFVDAYEKMVSAMRTGVIQLLSAKGTHMLVSVALHHRALSAQPRWEILRGVIGQLYNEGHRNDIAKDDLKDLVSALNTEISSLIEMRNILLHATWLMYEPRAENADETGLAAIKIKGTLRDGFTPISMPETTLELEALASRCLRQAANLAVIPSLFQLSDTSLETYFQRDGKRWIVTEILPRAS